MAPEHLFPAAEHLVVAALAATVAVLIFLPAHKPTPAAAAAGVSFCPAPTAGETVHIIVRVESGELVAQCVRRASAKS